MVTIRQLSKTYSRGDAMVTALHEVDLEVRRGEFCAFVGPSGCGKSTLLNLVAGLDHPTSGEIVIDGRSTSTLNSQDWTTMRRETIGIVFQAFHLVHGLTAEENIALPLMLRGEQGRDIAARVDDLLHQVGMSHRRRHRPGELSGGEQQRVAIARALAHRPRLLLADEPTGNVDSHQGAEIMALIQGLARSGGQTVLLVTHSAQAASAADYTWTMRDGRMVSRTTPSTQSVLLS
ncbi:MAG: ABC transporter ATP-binding protein [Nitrospira sp.]|nr:ABC transporter ATP-binding protein [Nitrospira sp.]MDH4303974.1 ABC transporter ATP-binding protein [Nitrospira sp.]MDH5194948.1 ABC transporter ATP-binding protein [Nitrospira sp.]